MSTRSTKPSLYQRLAAREQAPETHLIKTLAFWVAITPPLVIGLVLALIAGFSEKRLPDFSTIGYNVFLTDFKLPIAIMSLAIPLGALAAAIHRSVQTSRQIKEQYAQNVFSNHLAHRDYFFKFIKDFDPFSGISINHAKAYETLFPKAVNGVLSPNRAFVQTALGEIYGIQETINDYLKFILVNAQLVKDPSGIYGDICDYEYFANSALGKQDFFLDTNNSDNAFPLIFKVINESYFIADGILQCSNFHQIYIDKHEDTLFDEIEDLKVNNTSMVEALRPYQNFYTELKDTLREYVDEKFSFRGDKEDAMKNFSSRLSIIPKNQNLEVGSDVFEYVIMNHLSREEQQIILQYSPAAIKMSIGNTT